QMLAHGQAGPYEAVIGLSTFRYFVAECARFESICLVMVLEYSQAEFTQIGRLAAFIPDPLCYALQWTTLNLEQLIIELRSTEVERDNLERAHDLCPATQKFCSRVWFVSQQ